MPASILIPFDTKPVSTQRGTGTYTCPAGKFAKVTVTVSGTATSTFTPTTASTIIMLTSGNFNHTFDVIVNPGDTISGSLSNASGTTAVANGSGGAATGTTTATVNYNSNSIAVFQCETSASIWNGGAGSINISRSGSSNFTWYAQEYGVIS